MTLTILGISGSLREGAVLQVADLHPIPLYDGDVEAVGMPAAVDDLRAKIRNAAALLVATPEYNHSVSGVLKNAIDWASRPPDQPFAGKPVAMFGGGAGFGTVRSQLHLRQILAALGAFALPKPDVWVSNVHTRFDGEMNLVDESVRQQLAVLVAALVAFAKR